MLTWRLWPLLPQRSIPRYLEHMERDCGLRFSRLSAIPIVAGYRPIHRLHAARYDVDYFPSQNAEEIQEYLDICQASGWEVVLQLDRYKIFRELPQGAIPLYTEEAERRTHWKQALKKYCVSAIGLSALLLAVIWLVFRLLGSDNFFLSALYGKPLFQQLVYLSILPLLAGSFAALILGGLFISLPWRRPLPGWFFRLGILFRLLFYLADVVFFGSVILSGFLEFEVIAGILGVLIGVPLGRLRQTWYGENAASCAQMKGRFPPPKWMYLAACAAAVAVTAGSFFFEYEVVGRARDRGDAVYVHSQNIVCSEIIYDATAPKYNRCAYELRSSSILPGNMAQHEKQLVSAIISQDIIHYFTAEDIERLAGEDQVDKRPHKAAIDELKRQLHPDEIWVNEFGTRYLLRFDRRVYRLCSPAAFYDHPYPESETEIQQIGNEIFTDLAAQISMLENMFSD